jgi:acetyl-CoA carboxylase carboxyl transferase subunit beta
MRSAPARLNLLDRIATLPDGTFRSCAGCSTLIHHARLAGLSWVCPECGCYFRLTAHERIALLADPGSFTETAGELTPVDHLEFVDRMPYPDRIARARAASRLTEAVVTGTALFGGRPAVIAVMDFGFLGGSMGSVVGEKITLAAETALARRIPLLVVSASGGARMQEGVFSLLQMAKTAAAVRRLRDAGVPFVSVLTDPVYGGVAASFANLGDVIMAEAGARAGFAGPKVIEQTIRSQLPTGFQTAQFLLDHGHIDLIAQREDLGQVLRALIAVTTAPPVPGDFTADPAQVDTEANAWEVVGRARHPDRPNLRDYVENGFSGFLELHGDRLGEDDPAVAGGFAWLGEQPVMVVGHAKGRTTSERVRRNFGMPHPSGYRKAMRLYQLAERLGIPVVTLVDTAGAYPGTRAEEGNQSGAIAEALALLAGLRVPVVTVVTGEGGSGGALALAVGDRLLMQENTTLSVISPEGCATILFGDASRAPDAARSLRPRAIDLYRQGVADELIPEPPGGAHTDRTATVRRTVQAVRRHLADLLALSPEALLDNRYRRLRDYGTVGPHSEPAEELSYV